MKTDQLLQIAANEIKGLRTQNTAMRLRLDMFDDCMALLNSRINEVSQGYSEDIVYQIEKHIEANKQQD